ncbi:hypothetical protein [uncultured Psychrobacter sp.]|uniref:hypothetical protein n=1 Tax=uncultured Psychrobacter sp. TaxID=259303 RepID=UPI0030DB8953
MRDTKSATEERKSAMIEQTKCGAPMKKFNVTISETSHAHHTVIAENQHEAIQAAYEELAAGLLMFDTHDGSHATCKEEVSEISLKEEVPDDVPATIDNNNLSDSLAAALCAVLTKENASADSIVQVKQSFVEDIDSGESGNEYTAIVNSLLRVVFPFEKVEGFEPTYAAFWFYMDFVGCDKTKDTGGKLIWNSKLSQGQAGLNYQNWEWGYSIPNSAEIRWADITSDKYCVGPNDFLEGFDEYSDHDLSHQVYNKVEKDINQEQMQGFLEVIFARSLKIIGDCSLYQAFLDDTYNTD